MRSYQNRNKESVPFITVSGIASMKQPPLTLVDRRTPPFIFLFGVPAAWGKNWEIWDLVDIDFVRTSRFDQYQQFELET